MMPLPFLGVSLLLQDKLLLELQPIRHVIMYCSHPQSQQNVGTKAFVSEHPDKTHIKLQARMS